MARITRNGTLSTCIDDKTLLWPICYYFLKKLIYLFRGYVKQKLFLIWLQFKTVTITVSFRK